MPVTLKTYIWERSQGQNFVADNVGINHLFLRDQTSSTDLGLSFDFESTVVPEPPSSLGLLVTLGTLLLLWGRRQGLCRCLGPRLPMPRELRTTSSA